MCLIFDTAKKLHCPPRAIFGRAAELQGFTNAKSIADYRFDRWFKYGEITEFVESFCLNQWREENKAETSAP